MDEEKKKKLQLEREKLAEYKRKKSTKEKCTSDASNSSGDNSLSLTLLPENRNYDNEQLSDTNSISEHILSSNDSIENDRSFQEIEISNIPHLQNDSIQALEAIAPSRFSLILQNVDQDVDNISQENKPFSLNENFSMLSLNLGDKLTDEVDSSNNNVQSILEEILNKKMLYSDNSLQSDERSNSNLSSLNIFEGVNLDDKSITNYVTRLKINESDTKDVRSEFDKIKHYEELITTKDMTITALNAELDSLREIASNASTNSLNTSTTEYKQLNEEYRVKIVEFENAIAHRDRVIEQLAKSLEESALSREDLKKQTEELAQEVLLLQEQCAVAAKYIKQQKCAQNTTTLDENQNSDANKLDVSNRLESVTTQDGDNLNKNVSKLSETTSDHINLTEAYEVLQSTLNASQLNVMNELKIKIQLYVEQKLTHCKALQDHELKLLKEKLENEKNDYDTEISRLQELLLGVKCGSNEFVELRQELETKHAKEMEELRTYFEQKCTDMEKHYSEEVFSQQSRKMSGSSSISDAELASDLFLVGNPQPGPGGDNMKSTNVETSPFKSNVSADKNVIELRKLDIIEMKNELNELNSYLNKYDVEKLNSDDLNGIREDLAKYNLRNLTKVHLNAFKTEMQNKYHAELEILREDYENKIDMLNVEHEKKHQIIERKYEEKIENLQYDLDEALKNAAISVSNAVQEVASSGEYELADVVQSYERRLQEQVTMAKFDIIAALEHQIQTLASSPIDNNEWPTELMMVRNKFANKYETQISELKDNHEKQISELKEDYMRKLDRARRRSLKEDEKNVGEDDEYLKERDRLRRSTAVLRNLLRELLKYFTECEDELNNTLVDEILKQNIDKNVNRTDPNFVDTNESLNITKRVHFTPNFNDFLNIVDNTSFGSLDSNDLSIEFKNELGSCLERLKSEANAVLALTTNVHNVENVDNKVTKCDDNSCNSSKILEDEQLANLEKTIVSLTRQLKTETSMKNNLNMQLNTVSDHVKSLEEERISFENEIEQLLQKQRILENGLRKAKEKIADLLECQQKEIVSEGFGESISGKNRNLDKKRSTLMELQEKARNLISDNTTDNALFQLIDDLCREADVIVEESKREKEDLILQVRQLSQIFRPYTGDVNVEKIEAADKKLKSTCEFLEIQANEREQERDEAQKEIETLKEQIRDREKDRVSCERINKEVELLEQQMNDMTKFMKENDAKQQEIENERKEAVDKIYILREIIRDLESQVETKVENETQLKNVITELESLINQQTKLNDELTEELTSLKSGPDGKKCQEIIVQLEEELQKFKLNAELTGNESVLEHIKIQLFDIESSIDGRTRDLEALHAAISSTTCSSPTEDMSIKDQIRPHTPNSTLDDCDVPLQQLARLKEKLIKHTRAEDAAVKRIRDLEMQLTAFKRDYEEVQADKDMLQEKISDQLVLIASLQMRLDEQRLRADNVSKQTNTSLEIRIYDLENEVQNLTEKICNRDKTIKQLNNAIDETKKRLEEREMELLQMTDEKNYIDLENENDKLRKENQLLKDKINIDVQNVHILPNLVDNIIADKNADLDKLREEINITKKQLEFYTSLNFDKEQLKTLSQLKSPERALTEILTLLEESDRTRAEAVPELVASPIQFMQTPNTTQLNLKNTKFPSAETFRIELENTPKPQSNSTEIMKSSEKKVHFEDIATLKEELNLKEEIITEYNKRLHILEEKYEVLQNNLEITENALKEATETFQKEQNDLKEIEQNLRVELVEKKINLSEIDKKLELEKQDSSRKDQMYIDLAKQKRDLEKQIKELQETNQQAEEMKKQLADCEQSTAHINKLEDEMKAKTEEVDSLKIKLQQIQEEVTEKSRVLKQFSDEMNEKSDELKKKDEENTKLLKELKNKQSQINSLNSDLESLKVTIKEKDERIQKLSDEIQVEKQESLKEYNARIKELQNLLTDKDCEIEILNEDINRYQNEISKLELRKNTESNFKSNEIQLQFMKNKKELASKDLEIVKLKSDNDYSTKEIVHLREYLTEKDKVIEQIKADSNSLRVNLETIQTKIQETGNILDLRNRLQEQIEINKNLQSEITNLRHSQIESKHSLDEIEGQVREQLSYSAHLDSSILSAINSGSEQEDSEHLRQLLRKQKSINSQLKDVNMRLEEQLQDFERRVQGENMKVSQFEILLENEKRKSEAIQLEDANLIEQMRLRLDVALENEKEFEKILANEKDKFNNLLENEKKIRVDLETKLTALKSGNSSNTNSRSETEYKSLPNLIQVELEHVKKELELVKEENSKLKRDIKTLKQSKFDSETNCKYLNDMLKLKSEEIGSLECRISNNKQMEQELREKFIAISTELDQRNREVENSRTLLEEMEEDRNLMKNDITRLKDQIKELQEERQMNELLLQENDAHMTSTIPEKFMKKIKELSNIAKDQVRNNKVITDMLAKSNEERRTLQDKIAVLEAQNNLNMPFDDPVARANHLFGKYLRSESYRKALVFQKNYLLGLLATYQYFRPVSTNPTLQNLETLRSRNTRRKGISRFKIIVHVLISISRMHFMVQRWHTGKRLGATSVPITHSRRQLKTNVPQQTAFQLGQPVSSQNFSNSRTSVVLNRPLQTDDPNYNNQNNNVFNDVPSTSSRSAFNDDRLPDTPTTQVPHHELPPWSGATPPSKDRSLKGSSRDLPITTSRGDGSALRDNLATLSSPELLSRYVERFNQIQTRLGIALENTNSS